MESFQQLVADSLSASGFDTAGESGFCETGPGLMFPHMFPWAPFLLPFPPKFPMDSLPSCPLQMEMDNLHRLQEVEWPAGYSDSFSSLSSNACETPVKAMKYKKVEVELGPVGTLTKAERREKILKYQEKRRRRTFTKRISYQCRKRVADQRLRVKGRFVSSKQAECLRGLENEKNNVSWPWQPYI